MPTALLLTSDKALRASVQKAVDSVDQCQLRVVDRAADRKRQLEAVRPNVLLMHVAAAEDEALAMNMITWCRTNSRGTAVVPICDRYETLQAVKLLAHGAADYLARPLDLRRLSFVIDMLTFKPRHCAGGLGDGAESAPPPGSVGRAYPLQYDSAEEMARIVEQVRLLAPLPTTVLLSGEIGTGKSRLARVFHELSPRASEPFVTINCGALSPNLIESEMFGHVKGAFPGAETDRAGKFAAAGTGTLLLDDVEALPLAVQAKLLRAIDDREFEPVGCDRMLPLMARIIAATSGSLEEELSAGRFRSDLYYRINAVTLHLPPLRARRSVMAALVASLVADIASEHQCPPPPISPQAVLAIELHTWPGNIRELRNVLERAVVLYPGKPIDLESLPAMFQEPRAGSTTESSDASPSKLHEARFDAEFRTLREALGKSGNNRARAARQLGISRVTLYKKLHKYDLI